MVAKAMEEDAAMRRGGGHMDPFQLQFPLQSPSSYRNVPKAAWFSGYV